MTDPDLPPSDPVSHLSLFTQARELLEESLSAAATVVLPALAGELESAAERTRSEHERQSLLQAAFRLRRETSQRVARLAEVFERRALRCERFARAQEAGEAMPLALIDDEELDQQITAAELANAARERAGVTYPVYIDRLRALSDLPWTDDDDRNPLGARTLATAAVAAVEGSSDDAPTRELLRQAALPAFAAAIADAISAADRMLSDAGVTPLPPDTEPLTSLGQRPAQAADVMQADDVGAAPSLAIDAEAGPAAAASASAAAPTNDEALNDMSSRAVEAAARADQDAVMLGSSALATLPGGNQLRALPTLQPVADIEQDAVAFAHAIGALPYSRQARSEFFGNIRSRLRQSAAMPAQLAVVDVVAAMFDYVIDDRRLPEAAKPLVWRLQQPAVALSLLDPAYLGDDPRSLRRLVENFGAIATAFADDLTRGSELHRRLETVVRAVEIVSSALQTRSAVMAMQVEKEYTRAARSVGQLIERVARERRSLEETPGRRNRRDYSRRPSREREKAVTEHLRNLLSERLDRHGAPESVREFVMSVWLRHMRTAALRNGEESAEFKVALQVVDELLWSLNGSGERRSRRELAKKIPPLIRLMTQGVREIGAKDEEFKSFFDELFLIHLRRMQRQERGGVHALGMNTVGAAGATEVVPTLNHRVDGADAIDTAGNGDDTGDTAAATLTRTVPPLAGVARAAAAAAAELQAEDTGSTGEPRKAIEPDRALAPDSSEASGAARLPDVSKVPDVSKAADSSNMSDASNAPKAPAVSDMSNVPGGSSAAHAVPAAAAAGAPMPAVGRTDAGRTDAGRTEPLEADGTERRLLEILNSLDLTDLPEPALPLAIDAQTAFDSLARGQWLELISRTGERSHLKVAWINRRRTVTLLVRQHDRRALSLRMDELRQRFEQERAFVVRRDDQA